MFLPPLHPTGRGPVRDHLLAKFALASLVPIVLLGVVLAGTLERQIRDRALANARQDAELTARLGIQPLLGRDDLGRPLPQRSVAALDRALRSGSLGEVARVKVWSRDGRIRYSDDHALIGRAFAPSEELGEALDGEVASEISDLEKAENTDEARYGRLLEVYVPLRSGHGGRPAGVFELYLPYSPIAATIRSDTRRLSLVLLAGLALLYAALFRIVTGASRRLRRQAEENEYLALHDALTGLPNRTLFRDRVQQAILTAKREGASAAVLLMDLDRFKEINDTLGHHSGDVVLQGVGPRLRTLLRESDSVARLGGDEFAVLLPKVADAAAAVDVAARIRATLERPFDVSGLSLETDASIGIALYPDHGTDVDTLIQRADVAMYLAKDAHTGQEVYAAEQDAYSPARLTLLAELRRALDERELVVFYHPKADLQTGRVRGVEALARWQHPERGLLPPDEFIPLAEHTGLIRALTRYVLDEALRQCSRWRQDGLELAVAVNLSGRDLLDLQLPDDVVRLLEKWNLDPTCLELEITESTILGDPARAKTVLCRLSEMGVRLAIDDFGSGYTSLAYLKRLPVDELKIDKSFVMNMISDENDAVIVRSTIDLGRNLGLGVVAEGVESAEIWDELGALGCDVAQGYFLTRPIAADALTAWLRTAAAAVPPLAAASSD